MPDEDLRQPVSPVVLFDGVCNLCDRSVQFVIRNDPAGLLRFSPLQSSYGSRLVEHLNVDRRRFDPERLNTFIVVIGDDAYFESDAWMQIFRRLNGPARWLAAIRFVPRWIRDGVYRFVGAHRYQWFGRKSACMVPSPEIARRFRFELEVDEGA